MAQLRFPAPPVGAAAQGGEGAARPEPVPAAPRQPCDLGRGPARPPAANGSAGKGRGRSSTAAEKEGGPGPARGGAEGRVGSAGKHRRSLRGTGGSEVAYSPAHGRGALPYPPRLRSKPQRFPAPSPRYLPQRAPPQLPQRSLNTAARPDVFQPPRPSQERASTAPCRRQHIPPPHSRWSRAPSAGGVY
ncbi:hypothetical protein Nmel_003664 [Mimus melanotis]